MHISDLAEKFKFFVGKTVYSAPVQQTDQKPPSNQRDFNLDDKRNLNLFKRIRSLAHKFNAELVIDGLPHQEHAACKVYVHTERGAHGHTITGFEPQLEN